jgi:hypothetical protein
MTLGGGPPVSRRAVIVLTGGPGGKSTLIDNGWLGGAVLVAGAAARDGTVFGVRRKACFYLDRPTWIG